MHFVVLNAWRHILEQKLQGTGMATTMNILWFRWNSVLTTATHSNIRSS